MGSAVIGQTEEKKSGKKDWTKVSFAKRAADHLMIQLGMYNWAQKPDSIRTKGVGRTANLYLLFDFPFKTNPKFSAAIGLGLIESWIGGFFEIAWQEGAVFVIMIVVLFLRPEGLFKRGGMRVG